MMRRITPLGPVVLALALAGCQAAQPEAPTPTPIPPPVVAAKPTYTVQRGEIVRQVQLTGRIAPVKEERLFFPVSGRVRNVYVQQGALVPAGQLLADLELGDQEYDYQRAQLNLDLARLNLEHAQAQPESRDKAYLVAKAELEARLAQITFDQLQEAMTNAQLNAPFDGQVLSLDLSAGDQVEAFSPVMLIADPGQLEVSAAADGSDLGALAEGMLAMVAPDSETGQLIQGTIRQLPYPYGSGSRDAADDSVRVALAASAARAGYRPGDRVRVTVVLDRKADVLWLPPSAIRTFNGRQFVVVQEGESQRRVDVEVGLEDGQHVEILSGLTEGQVIVGP